MAASRIKSGGKTEKRRVGLVYDERMCKHHANKDHHENPTRIKAIWEKLQGAGIPQRCVVLNAKKAEDKHLRLVHSQKYVNVIKNKILKDFNREKAEIELNKGSSESAYLAAGSVKEVTEQVAKGELNSAVAIVRPPGHHAEHDTAMGFCIYNNVAVAASFLLKEKPELGINKILIVDWDVHHGNGTQKMFLGENRVLFFSVHRHDSGKFYPCNHDGFYNMVGDGPGAGYNINVPWENDRRGDADYLAVWDHILIPVAKEFNPDIIIVSAGFDAADGDPLGECCVTPSGYSIMLKKLMDFANGKVVLALEGGYNHESTANSMLACVEVLLGDKSHVKSPEANPFESTWRVIQQVRQQLSAFWQTLAEEKAPTIPDNQNPDISTKSLPESPATGLKQMHIKSAEEPRKPLQVYIKRSPKKAHTVNDSCVRASSICPRVDVPPIHVNNINLGTDMIDRPVRVPSPPMTTPHQSNPSTLTMPTINKRASSSNSFVFLSLTKDNQNSDISTKSKGKRPVIDESCPNHPQEVQRKCKSAGPHKGSSKGSLKKARTVNDSTVARIPTISETPGVGTQSIPNNTKEECSSSSHSSSL